MILMGSGCLGMVLNVMYAPMLWWCDFKETSDLGDFNNMASLFGDGNSNHGNRAAHILAAETVLREQKSSLSSRIKAGGEQCALHWELDATPQQVTLTDAQARLDWT